LFLFLIDYNNVGCLEMLGVGGPDWVHSGDVVELVCKYDLGREHIYSVKWYKDNAEIWRYLPNDKYQKTRTFPIADIKIENSTRPHSLVLRVSGHTASGSYKCEVSVEKSFYTLSSSKNLTVVVPPLSAPIITGGQEFYSEGDLIHLTCMSNMSQPAAKLTWTINDRRAEESLVHNNRVIQHSDSGLETSLLDLKLKAVRSEFPGGVCKIKCKADIAGGVWATSQSQVLSVGDSASSPNLHLNQRTNKADQANIIPANHLNIFIALVTALTGLY